MLTDFQNSFTVGIKRETHEPALTTLMVDSVGRQRWPVCRRS